MMRFIVPISIGVIVGRATLADASDALLWGFECLQRCETPEQSAELIGKYGLPWEAVQSAHLSVLKVVP